MAARKRPAAKRQPTTPVGPASVVEAVTADLAKLPDKLGESALGWMALSLARELDSSRNSATSKSMCARALQDILGELREIAPPAQTADKLDELTRRREERHGRIAASSD